VFSEAYSSGSRVGETTLHPSLVKSNLEFMKRNVVTFSGQVSETPVLPVLHWVLHARRYAEAPASYREMVENDPSIMRKISEMSLTPILEFTVFEANCLAAVSAREQKGFDPVKEYDARFKLAEQAYAAKRAVNTDRHHMLSGTPKLTAKTPALQAGERVHRVERCLLPCRPSSASWQQHSAHVLL
jgi:hypothetical protein